MSELTNFPVLSSIFKRIWLQVVVLAAVLAGNVVLDLLPQLKEDVHGYTLYKKWATFLSIFVATWIFARVVSVFRESPPITKRFAPNIRALIFTFVRILIFALGILIGLDSIGISITPLLASLGVGSIAVGLALQDTLGNLFSGFYLYIDRPIAAGDWVRLDTGMEGQIQSIGWRSTHLLSGDSTVIIPNSKLSTSSVLNFSLPVPTANFNLVFGVAYESDLDHVEKTILDTITEVIAAHKNLATGLPPIIRYTKFGDSAIEVTVIIKAQSFPDQGELRHEAIKALRRRFKQEEIEMAYPKVVVRQVALES